MSDVMCWVAPVGDEFSPLNSLLYGSKHYTDELRLIIAEELKLESADKVDGLQILPLAVSSSKLVVLHVHAYRESFTGTTPETIAQRFKQALTLPEDQQCVSVGFYEVLNWGKA